MIAGFNNPMITTVTDIALYSIKAAIVLLFIVFAWRDLMMLFRRPAKNMGTGLSRTWSVARTTFLEAWAGRVWLLPLLWLITSFILIGSVRPFDESERIPLYIRMLLTGQQILLLVMLAVMACVSLPRERERKIMVTNASKPLSRLEIVLGKMVGFWTVAGAMLLFMGIASLGILYLSDYNLKTRAREAYELQKRDFARTQKAPSESLNRLADEGSLYAYNYITVPKDGMNIGAVVFTKDQPPVRFLMGGTDEIAHYRFYPYLWVPEQALTGIPGRRPAFLFSYRVGIFRGQNIPPEVKILVTAQRSDPQAVPPPRPQTKTITLQPDGTAYWEPDDPDEIFTAIRGDEITSMRGEVSVDVQCITPGVLLQVLEGKDPDPTTGAFPSDDDVNVMCVNGAIDRNGNLSLQPPLARPVVRGMERRDRTEISGLKPGDTNAERAMFRFAGASLRHIPIETASDGSRYFTLSLNLQTYKSENIDKPTIAAVMVRSLDSTGVPEFVSEQEVLEKRLMTVKVPEANLGDPDPAKRGDMIVTIFCETPGHSLSVLPDSIRIELPQSPFALNLFKSEAVLFLEAALLIAVAVLCSVRLGWPVAVFCTSICFIFGLFVDWISSLLEGNGLEALNYNVYNNMTPAEKVFDKILYGTWVVLDALARFVPNFTIFSPEQYIPNLQNMPWRILGSNFLDTTLFVLPVIALAYLLIRKQELG